MSEKQSEDFDRIVPQGIYDQSETFQVGGTVVNRNLNRREYEVEASDDADKRNLNELDEDNPAFDQAKHDKVKQHEDKQVQRRRKSARKSTEKSE